MRTLQLDAQLKPASYLFVDGFQPRTLVLIWLSPDNGLKVVISNGELSSMLSQRQHHILSFIHRHNVEHGFAPTIREICLATGITSTSVVNYNLERLIAWGYLVKSRGKSRALGLTERGSALFESNYPVKRKPPTARFPVDILPDADLPDRDAHQLHQENLLLRAENERLRRESKNRVAALQREIQYLSQELRQVQQSSEGYPA
jgi:SOS-response transcriptional repressor LexA